MTGLCKDCRWFWSNGNEGFPGGICDKSRMLSFAAHFRPILHAKGNEFFVHEGPVHVGDSFGCVHFEARQ